MFLIFNKFEILMGFRYLKSKKNDSFVSFISFISIIGIGLGVAALIVVLSVMNGFSQEIRNKIVGVSSHIKITTLDAKLKNWADTSQQILNNNSQVTSIAPFIEGQGLVTINGSINGVIITGVDSSLEQKQNAVFQSVPTATIERFNQLRFSILLSKKLAQSLGVDIGDKITVITPNSQFSAVGIMPRVKQFTVAGFFDAKIYEYDMGMVFINLQDAQILFNMSNLVTGLHVNVKDMMKTDLIKTQLENILPPEIFISDWMDQHQNYFAAVSLEKKMMAIILFLIVAVASFNLVSTLVMNVQNKKSDIAILRAMGASTTNIMKIFILQGTLAGIIGSITGTIFGILIATNLSWIVNIIEILTHSKLLSSEVYMIDYLPVDINMIDIITILLASILLSILSTIYPSIKAANTNPVMALRYNN